MCLLTDNQHLTFRGNSIGTKAMEAYMKLVGEKVGIQSKKKKMHMCKIAVGRKFQLSLLYTVVQSNYKTLPLISTYIFKLKRKVPVKLMLRHSLLILLEKFITGFTLCNLFVLTMVILDWD